MTREEAIKMLEAKLECLENNTSGDYKKCNNDCENCLLNYNQGNLGQQKEYLKMSIEALKEDLYKKAYMIEKVMQAKRQNNLIFNKYNKFYLLSLENYYNDVNEILSNLIKEFDYEKR